MITIEPIIAAGSGMAFVEDDRWTVKTADHTNAAHVEHTLMITNQTPSRVKRPAPGKWSVVEIVAHMAETEFAAGWRIRQALSSPGVALQAFDQDAWANTGHYDKRPASKWVEQFRVMREGNLNLTCPPFLVHG